MMTRHRMVPSLLPFLLAALSPLAAADDVVTQAMKDEMARSLQKLQLEKLEKPYFIAYRVDERTATRASASFGSLVGSGETRSRALAVEVRVGDYALDNTNFFSMASGPAAMMRMFGVRLPLEDDYNELRRQIWLATDDAYKRALEDISRKRAALQNKTRTDEIPDLSKEDPSTVEDVSPPIRVGLAEAQGWARELSALFREMPALFTSSVQFSASHVHTRYLNSEGSSFTRSTPLVSLTATAATQSPEGMPLEDFVAFYGRSLSDLPPKADSAARVREMGARLAQLREAPTLDQYNGPVLFEGQAAAELFGQVFASRLLAARRPVADSPQIDNLAAQSANPFLDRVGARVLPRFLSVVDNPLLRDHERAPLLGGYRVDDDGVRAAAVRVVENGMLKTLLATRNPVRGITRSTGHRRGAAALPSNLVVSAEGGVEAKALRAELMSLVKQRGTPYGIVVRRIANASLKASRDSGAFMIGAAGREASVESLIQAHKVFPDGREELVRNLELSGISETAFRDIVAASKEQTVYSAPFTARGFAFDMIGGEPGPPPIVSLVVPSLLFEEVTLKKPAGEIPKPPASKHPFFDVP